MPDAASPRADLLLAYGDDTFELDRAIDSFASRIGIVERTTLVPERRPDERAIERAGLEAASVPLFGGRHLVVLRQPLQAAGSGAAAGDRLLALVTGLPADAALALVEARPSRDAGRVTGLLARLIDAVDARGGAIEQRDAPRRRELTGWIARRAAELRTGIEPQAATALAERLGGLVWESDVERGEQTRVADAELRKLATFVGDRAIRASDVEVLVADARPGSVFAITNALERRDRAAMAHALERALAEGQPVLLIMASLQSRISDLIITRDFLAGRVPPAQIAKRLGRGNARSAERLAQAARRYAGSELEAMLRGLFAADIEIKANNVDPAAALTAWLGEHVLGGARRP